MIIAFCGHSNYIGNLVDEQKILNILENIVGDLPCEIFLGEYGGFDMFAYTCAKKFKLNHPKTKLVFITPYMPTSKNEEYTEYLNDKFDLIIYPDLESFPKKYAILYRNRWIATKADLVIAYITHKYGGAYAMYRHAKLNNKEILNLAVEGGRQY